MSLGEYTFNIDHGYLEGLVRGFRSGILDRADYLNLVQCETVDGELAAPCPLGAELHVYGVVYWQLGLRLA